MVWATLPPSRGSEAAERRPVLILQPDRYNRTAIGTVVVAAVTSNLRMGAVPSNVRLAAGEAGLSKPCLVNVTPLHSLDRRYVGDRIGQLAATRLAEVWAGVRLVLEPGV